MRDVCFNILPLSESNAWSLTTHHYLFFVWSRNSSLLHRFLLTERPSYDPPSPNLKPNFSHWSRGFIIRLRYTNPRQSHQIAITSTLQAQHASFVALASKTAALDAELQKLKNTYRQLWRAQTGSARDPFNELDRGSSPGGEFGLDGLSIK